MPSLRNQAHWLVAQKSQPTTKTIQRAWLPQPTGRLQIIKHENTTRNIRKPGDVGNLNFCTFNKNCSGLTSWSFEIPASAYCQTLWAIIENTTNEHSE